MHRFSSTYQNRDNSEQNRHNFCPHKHDTIVRKREYMETHQHVTKCKVIKSTINNAKAGEGI